MLAFVIAVVIGLLVAALFLAWMLARKRPEPVRTTPVRTGPPSRSQAAPVASSTGGVEATVAETPPLFDLDREPAAAPVAEIRWAAQFDSRSGTLDDTARLRLIGDLGVVAKEWCVPLLCEAYAQEQRPMLRQAALIALAACHSRTAVPTLRAALGSADADERAIATDALTDLEPLVQTKSRTVVERR